MSYMLIVYGDYGMRFIRRIKLDFAYVTNVLISLLLFCISLFVIVIVYRARISLLYIVYCMCSYIVFRFLCRFLVYECPLFLALYLSLSSTLSLSFLSLSLSLWQNTANCRSCQSCPCARRQSPVIICRWTVSVVLPIHVSSAPCCMPVRIQRAFCGINMHERNCWNAHALHNFCAP